jgi:nicotinamide mononucleotide transporter
MGVKWGAQLLPENIQEPQYPMVDAILTTASVVAQILLTRKKIDNWVIWVLVDVIYIGLFLMVGMYWTAGLYVVYTGIAVNAVFSWNKEQGVGSKE